MMSRRIFTALIAVLLPVSAVASNLADVHPGASPSYEPRYFGNVWLRSALQNVLYDNGPLVTCPGCGSGGADESRLQTALGLDTFGFGHQQQFQTRVADDFTIPAGGMWNIQQVTFFAYQTGSPTDPSPIVSVNYQIWDGPPDLGGSNVIFGDTIVNRLVSTAFSNIYRVSDAAPGTTDRPVMATVCSAGVTLGEGTYWIDWQCAGVVANSGPWVPPVTILGTIMTGNAKQFIATDPPPTGAWQDVLDTGTSSPQGLPFIIEGEDEGATAAPGVEWEAASWGGVKGRYR